MPRALALLALFAHVATSTRYGYFRDELYFIACSKHLAWGYVDQPPLVALSALIAAPANYHLTVLRLLPALGAAATVWLAARTAGELGARSFWQCVAALATLLLPAYLLLGNTLTTTSFEPFSWSLVLYCTIRMIRTGDRRYWLGIAAAFALGMYGKYSMLLLGATLVAALLCTPERRFLRTWWFPIGIALAGLLLSPNLAWQGVHGWPFLEVIRGDFAHRHAFQSGVSLEYTGLAQNAGAFALEQLLYTNPFTVPFWIAGIAGVAALHELRPYRFLALCYGMMLLAAVLLEAKGYYIIGVYAPLIAAGAAVAQRLALSVAGRAAVVAVFLAGTLPFVPLSLPVMPIRHFIAYSSTLHLTGARGTPPRVIQPVYAEEFGWRELAQHVAAVYRALPPSLRARTGIFADTYGDAGALNFYGPAYGLPRAVSAQNTFYLWGTHRYDGKSLIVVGATQAPLIHRLYRHMRLVATYGNPYKWIVEGPTPIYLCSDPVAPLPQLWPLLRWYGA